MDLNLHMLRRLTYGPSPTSVAEINAQGRLRWLVHGAWPGLADAALDDEDLAATTDSRNLLGELLTKSCGAGSPSGVFPGLSYSALGIAH